MGYPAYMPSVQTSCGDRKAATPKSSESPGAMCQRRAETPPEEREEERDVADHGEQGAARPSVSRGGWRDSTSVMEFGLSAMISGISRRIPCIGYCDPDFARVSVRHPQGPQCSHQSSTIERAAPGWARPAARAREAPHAGVSTACSVRVSRVPPAVASRTSVHRRVRQRHLWGGLAGRTVEASSPALIEKVRSVITDGTGQYKIVDLRPGIYSVTFTLTGFQTVKREGIELAARSPPP